MKRVLFTVPTETIEASPESAEIPRHVQRQVWLEMGDDWQPLADKDDRAAGRFRVVDSSGDRVRCEAEVQSADDLLPAIQVKRFNSRRSGPRTVSISNLRLFLRPRIETVEEI